MKLQTLHLQDFLPFAGEQRLELEAQQPRNIVVIFGDNMRGKTSLINAIRWALYGKAVNRQGRAIPTHQILNRTARLEGRLSFSVTLELCHGGKSFTIRRTAEPQHLVADPKRPEDYIVSASLLKNGVPVRADQVDYEISRICPEQISRFFLFDGELLAEYETLLYRDNAQGKAIRESIERVLGVPTLINGRDDLQTLLREVRRENSQDLKQYSSIKNQVDRKAELESHLDVVVQDLEQVRTQAEIAKEKVTDRERILESGAQLLREDGELRAVLSRVEEVKEQRKEVRERVLAVRSDLWLDVLSLAVRPEIQRLESITQELLGRMSTYQRRQEEIHQLETELSRNHCPTCSQPLSSAASRQLEERLAQLKAKTGEGVSSRAKFDQANAQLSLLKPIRSNGTLGRHEELQRQVNTYETEMTKLEVRKAELEEALAGSDTDSLRRARLERDAFATEVSKLESQQEQLASQVKKYEQEIAVLEKLISRSEVEARTAKSTKRVENVQALHAIFGDAIEVLRDRLRTDVEQRATEAFLAMTTQGGYKGLKINDRYGLTIIGKNDEEVTIRSAGAEQVVALSLIDGLNRTSQATGPVVMDTPFGRLDPLHRKNILQYLGETTDQLVLLVHEGEFNRDADLPSLGTRIARVVNLVEVNEFHTRLEEVRR